MLETSTLLVRHSDPSGVRAIVDPATRKPLGYARLGRRPWWGLGPAVLEVHEQEDEPLLFTLRRGWGPTPRHEVRDAEETPVGLVGRHFLRDGWGRCVAIGEEESGGRAFRDGGGRLLARVARRPDGVEVAFTEAVAADPFAKMMLLAAALAV